MASIIPGTYPDSVPQTPEGETHQSAHPEQSRHARQPRTKLYKPAEPRGHHYTDSGAGLADPELTFASSSRPAEYTWTNPNEAIGGGTYVREHAQPFTSLTLESIRTGMDTEMPRRRSDASQYQYGSTRDRSLDRNLKLAGTSGGLAEPWMFDTEAKSRSNPSSSTSKSPPYWGSLPKGDEGAIHNTVAGHGSASDAHAEQHHMPLESTSRDRSVISGATGHPRGGVYNTVIGRGSQDDKGSGNLEGQGHKAAAPGALEDDMTAVSLHDIPEERHKTSRQVLGLQIPGTVSAARDDSLRVEASSRDSSTTGSARPDTPSHRAFPLVTGRTENRDSRQQSESPSHEDVAEAAAIGTGVAAAGAGIASSQSMEKRKKGSSDAEALASQPFGFTSKPQTTEGAATDQRRSSPADDSKVQEEGSPKGDMKHKILDFFFRSKDDKDEARRKSVGPHTELPRDDVAAAESPSRLRKFSRSEPKERKQSASAVKADTTDSSRQGKEKAAAGAAAGLGTFGILHHRKKDSISESPKETNRPIQGPMTADSGGAGPAGEAPQQIEQSSTPFEHPREPPSPPTQGADESRVGKPDSDDLLSKGTPSGVSRTTQSATRDIPMGEPGLSSDKSFAPGTASGVKASGIARKDIGSKDRKDDTSLASFGVFAPETGKTGVRGKDLDDYDVPSTKASGPEITRKDIASSKPGDDSTHKTSGTLAAIGIPGSGVASRDAGHDTTRAPASGIPSGTKHDSRKDIESGDRNIGTGKSKPSDDSAGYNILASGTPSGINVKSKSPRGSGSGNVSDSITHAGGTIPSRTTPHIHQSQSPTDITSGAQELKHNPPDVQHTFPSDTIPSHMRGSDTSRPNPSQESLPGITTYPRPETTMRSMKPEDRSHESGSSALEHQGKSTNMSPAAAPFIPSILTTSAATRQAHEDAPTKTKTEQGPSTTRHMATGMSPEIARSADTASAPHHPAHLPSSMSTTEKKTEQYDPPTRQMAASMSPEVMPASYTASAPRPPHHQGQDQDKSRTEHYHPTTNRIAQGTFPDTKSALHPSQHQEQSDPTTRQMAQGMSPEVMPSAYTSSSLRDTASRGQQTKGLGEAQQGLGQSRGLSQPLTGLGPSQKGLDQSQKGLDKDSLGLDKDQRRDQTQRGLDKGLQDWGQSQGPDQAQKGWSQSQGLGQAQQGPTSSTSSTSAKQQFQQPQQQQQYSSDNSRSMKDPALAAATSSWATAGKGSSDTGGVDRGTQAQGMGKTGQGLGMGSAMGHKLVHRCQHCGGENDVSEYFEGVRQALSMMGGR